MPIPRLDWSTAEVSESNLKVTIDGDTPRGWRETFERTATLLGGGGWDKVTLKKRAVHVSGVTVGSEDKLRHYLESLVQEANAAHVPDDDDGDSDSSDERDTDGRQNADNGAPHSPDTEMTEHFRSFARPPT